MIPEKINLEILTPEKKIYSGEVSSVRIPGIEGHFGVYPGHTPFVSSLRVGEIKIEVDGNEEILAASGGFVEVLPTGVSVLADTCEGASDIDLKRAESARERARERLEEGRKGWDTDRAQIALARAINRISVVSR